MGLQNYQEREWNCSMQERTDAMNHIFLICQLQESDKTSIFQTVLWSQLRGYLRGLLDRRQGRRRLSGLDSASVPLPPGCPRKPLLASVLCSRVFCLVGFCFCLFVFLPASGESSFPNQGSNPWPLQLEAWRLNHWTTRKIFWARFQGGKNSMPPSPILSPRWNLKTFWRPFCLYVSMTQCQWSRTINSRAKLSV